QSSSSQTFAPEAPPLAGSDDPFAASLDAVKGPGAAQGVDSLFGIPSGHAENAAADIPPPPQPQTSPVSRGAGHAPQVNVAVEVTAPVNGVQQTALPGAEVRQLAALLGIEKLSDEQLQSLMPEVSGIVNEAVTRLIDLLRARTAIKNELRVQHTMIQTMDNNPLKFSANATDALKMMFTSDASAFMRPQEAIRDSFDDLSDHQVAVLK
ncbi:MAG: type VI secretion system-associated FHA domain protein, partial [Thalassolituus sp.]